MKPKSMMLYQDEMWIKNNTYNSFTMLIALATILSVVCRNPSKLAKCDTRHYLLCNY